MTASEFRRRLRSVADRVVRHHAAAALMSCGFVASGLALQSLEELDDERKVGRAMTAIHAVTSEVLASPPTTPDDRALVALVAAQEAVALASLRDPTERDVRELLDVAVVAADAARDRR